MNTNNYPFLTLLSKPLDDAQSNALQTTKNAVIAAGAGSGKTQVLASRFAWLVLTGKAKADEILTLTFTNKAAAEMYQRIYDTLKMYAEHEVCPQLTETQQQRAKQALADFANAHVQTLDSYCSNIVRQCSNRYGIRPDFSVGSADGERDIKDKALLFTMRNATVLGIKTFADSGKLQEFSEQKLARAISAFTNLTTPAGFFSSKLEAQKKYITKALNYYCQKLPAEDKTYPGEYNLAKILDQVTQEFAESYDHKKQAIYKGRIDQAFDLICDSVIGLEFTPEEVFDSKSEKIKDCINRLLEFEEKILGVAVLRSGYNSKVRPYITRTKNLIFPVLDSIIAYIQQYEAIVSLYSLFDKFLEEVNSAKRISGNLSFADVSELALKVLIENEDIREQEINAYKKIMIDEFQDNNGKNRDLLYLLSLKSGIKIDSKLPLYPQIIQKDSEGNITNDNRNEEKLFFVGDEKQSIYKFRGADVSVFNELTKAGENLLIPMTYNYRSDPETVKAFNEIFKNNGGIFGNYEDALDYEAYYKQDALKNGKELPELNALNVPIHIRFVNTDKISKTNEAITRASEKLIPANEQIAYDVANRIYELGKDSKEWNSFAILDKSRTHRNIITKYLSLFNIPYELDQFNNIFEDGIVNDFYNFLRLCVYSSDVNAYAAYLTSPLAGLSENSMEIVLSHLVDINNYNFVFDPFVPADDEIKEDLNTAEFEKYIAARNFLQERKNEVLKQKLTATLDMLWNSTGYKYETMLSAQGDLASEQFDMLFELARTAEENGKSVSWFIDELESLKKQSLNEDSDLDVGSVSYPYERKPSVKIMTIHKSKGLQFDHVFILGCTDVSPKSDRSALFYEDETGLSVKPDNGTKNFFCIRLQEMERKKELAEFRRLIYVGITRAIKDIYIAGSWNPNSSTKDEEESEFHIFERLVKKFLGRTTEEELTYVNGASFDFINITPVSYSQSGAAIKPLSTDQLRSKKISEVESVYESAEEIVYQTNAIPRSCPSALEKPYEEGTVHEPSEDAHKDNLRIQTVGEEELENAGFNAADFGTLVHAYLEAQAIGIPPEEFQPPVKLFKGLSEEKKLEQIKECIKYCHLFEETEGGKGLKATKESNRFYRAEWAFKMFWDKTIWTGSIDLIFENADGTYTIVDYKSDNKVDEEKYVGQQNCYRTAAAKLLKVDESKIECKLWFMKSNTTISLKPGDRQ